MGLKAEVSSLEGIDEQYHGLYEKHGEGFRLSVEGVEFPDDVAGLKKALDTERTRRKEVEKQIPEGFSPERWSELTEAEKKREEDKAKAEGRWEDLRSKLQQEHKAALTEKDEALGHRDGVIRELTVTTELQTALADAGVRPKLIEAAVAYFEKKFGPEVEWEDGKMPRGVIPDEVHGNQPIADFVKAWAETEEADDFIESSGGTGGGAAETQKRGDRAVKTKADLKTVSEKVAYIKAHGDDAFLALPDR